VKNLVDGLGIPAKALLKNPSRCEKVTTLDPARFPIAEMVKRNWFPNFHGRASEARERAAELVSTFTACLRGYKMQFAFNRQKVRTGSTMDEYSLAAWRTRVTARALTEPLPPYRRGAITMTFLRELVRLSYLADGPKLAKEFLNKKGIHLVAERHLPKTFLDGAAMKLPDGSPLVAMTLRHDRLDDFWFTLCHECAHVALHLDRDGVDAFFDDVSQRDVDECEQEADEMAREALIPGKIWAESGLSRNPTPEGVRAFADKLRINAAIPAGRIRFEKDDYTILKELVGSGKVRPLFG
jgi:HTH-type transcriptional regulator/antitoxin HigA